MQLQDHCFTYDDKNRVASRGQLQPDHMNGGYMPKSDGSSYDDPEAIALSDNETLQLTDSGSWAKIPHYIGTKLYSISDRTEKIITEVGKTPADYPDYTECDLSNEEKAYLVYYDYTDGEWVFNVDRYRTAAKTHVTALCESANYTMLPSRTRDNIYAGSPASDDYPPYLQGDAGRSSIAKLNKIYKDISDQTMTAIQSLATRAEIDAVIASIVFPTEDEVLTQILSE